MDNAKNLVGVAGKIRVYCSRQLADSVEASIEWPLGIQDLMSAIEGAAD